MMPAMLDPTCMHPSTDDIGVHLRLDHPHFPHCKQRRPIRLVGEFTLRPGSVGGLQKLGFRYGNGATASPGRCRRRIRDPSHVSHLDLRHSRMDWRLSPLDKSRRSTDCRGWIPTRNDRDTLTGFRRRHGLESTGQERQPRAALSSGRVQSRLLSCPRHRGEAAGQAGDVARQVNNLTRRVDDLAGGGRKGLRGRRTGSRPKSICGKSASSLSAVAV